MKQQILALEKSLFKHEYLSDTEYLDEIIDDRFIEIGKSGKQYHKEDVINDLSSLKEDRKITIYDFTCENLSEDIYLAHYITKSDEGNIYRTSIWKKEDQRIKIVFHQASLYRENVDLTAY